MGVHRVLCLYPWKSNLTLLPLGFCHVWLRLCIYRGWALELPAFKTTFGLDGIGKSEAATISSNVVSCFQAGAFFGAIIGFALAENFGRKPVILGSGVPFAVGVAVQLVGKIALFYLGRALTGLGVR